MRETLFVRHGRLHYFFREIFKRLRVPAPDASKVADVLVAADLAGVESQGVSRLCFIANRLSSNLINPRPNLKVVHQAPAAATLDGDNGLGPVVAIAAMEIALSKAERSGAASVAVRRSNDFGMAGYYARMAVEKQMIGIAMSNAAPSVVPPYGTRPLYGVNPLSIAIPTVEGTSPFVLDMCTSASSRGKIEEARARNESLPEGWAVDESGRPATDPEVALRALRLLPLGSRPDTGSPKGFGLGLAVEILAGVLSGGAFGAELSGAEGAKPGVAKLGHFFAAVRIRSFGPWAPFRNRIAEMLGKITSSPASGAPRVYFPGELEYEIERRRRAEGIPLPPAVAGELQGMARGLDLHDAWEHLITGRK